MQARQQFNILLSLIGSTDGFRPLKQTVNHTTKTKNKNKSLLLMQFSLSLSRFFFLSLLAQIATAHLPLLPVLGVILNDLAAIEDSMSDTEPPPNTHLIHFEKYRKLAALIREMIQQQQSVFALHPVPALKDELLRAMTSVQSNDLDELYRKSVELEPKSATELSPRKQQGSNYNELPLLAETQSMTAASSGSSLSNVTASNNNTNSNTGSSSPTSTPAPGSYIKSNSESTSSTSATPSTSSIVGAPGNTSALSSSPSANASTGASLSALMQAIEQK